MKKLLFCIMLIAFQCSALLAQSDGAIYIDMTQPDGTNNRFSVKLTNDAESICKLETAVSSQESQIIHILEYKTGITVLECELITDGSAHTYIFPGLERGVYVIYLETAGKNGNAFKIIL